MHERPFKESGEPEMSDTERLRRQIEATQDEVDDAKLAGEGYDEIVENEAIIQAEQGAQHLQETQRQVDELTRDARYFLDARGDILNPGSFDANLALALGLEVSVDFDLLSVVVDKAKERRARRGEEGRTKIRVEELIPAWQEIEQDEMEREQSQSAAGYAMGHAIDPDDIRDLLENSPKEIRSFVRMLRSPAAAKLERELAEDMAEGAMYPYEEIRARLVGILARHNREMAKLEAGDPEAMERRRQDPRVHEALGDAFSTQIPDTLPPEETQKPE